MNIWIIFALFLGLVACSPPLSRQKRSRICYDGMECFQNLPPFDNADGLLPQPPSHIATVFRLFTRNCTTIPRVLHQVDKDTNTNCGFDSSLPTKIICHGFLQHGQVKWVQDMAREFLKKGDTDTNTNCGFDSSLPTKIICHGFLQHGQVKWVQDMAREFLKKGDTDTNTNCGFDSSLPTKIICHGFLQHGQVKWVQDMAREFLKKDDTNTNTNCGFDSSLPTKIICHGFLQHGQVKWVQDMAREFLKKGDTNTNTNCGFDSSLPTKIICHGFLQHGQVKWVQDMAREFLKKGGTNSPCGFDNSLPTKIICHGFLQHGQLKWVQDMAREFLKKAPMNVITVDWGRGSWFPYSQAVANTRVVGYEIARMLTHLSDNNGLSMDDVHIVGHSLGAHIAGYAGNHVPGIARITGLDPAEPDFKDTATSVHLDKSDANFVDIIHTDGSEFNYDSGFGWIQEVGHIDFYPNGGENQPGCSTHVISGVLTAAYYDGLTDAENELSCSHSRSIRLFNESINSPCPFYGHPCTSLEALDNNQANCLRCENNRCPLMGYDADQTQARGKFYLRTRPSGPFCGHTQHVEVEFDHMVPANGDVTVELDGDDQTSDSITISSGERPFVGGDQRRILFVDREPVDHVQQVRVTFNSTSSGSWLWFGEDHSSVVITKVTVTSAENGRRIHFCEHWATGISNGETVTLTHSSTDPGECPMPSPRHGFFQHKRPSFRQ